MNMKRDMTGAGVVLSVMSALGDVERAGELHAEHEGHKLNIFDAPGDPSFVADALGALRQKIGHEKGFATSGWKPLWVVDFPMFEYDEAEQRWSAMHPPFTSPKDGHEDLMDTDPGACIAKAYDMVLNGWELGGGSVRIHRQDIQSKVFTALNIDPEEARHKFGFLLDAFGYGLASRAPARGARIEGAAGGGHDRGQEIDRPEQRGAGEVAKLVAQLAHVHA